MFLQLYGIFSLHREVFHRITLDSVIAGGELNPSNVPSATVNLLNIDDVNKSITDSVWNDDLGRLFLLAKLNSSLF